MRVELIVFLVIGLVRIGLVVLVRAVILPIGRRVRRTRRISKWLMESVGRMICGPALQPRLVSSIARWRQRER